MSGKKWGVIGPGRIAEKFVKDLSLVKGGTLQAVASRNASRAKDFAQQHGAPQYYSGYTKMIKSGHIDIAYISTPHTFHKEQTLLCLENNVPVLCEKPAGINRREVQEVINASQRNQTFFMEALWSRFIPSMIKVLEIIDSGEMGEVENVEAEFCFSAPKDTQSRLYNLALGGGATLDIGIYPLFLAYLLLGVPERIEASGQLSDTGADQTCSINLFYPDKKMAAVHTSILYRSDMPARITMSKGYILMQPRWHESPALIILKAGHDAKEILCPPVGKGYSHEIEECHLCLDTGQIESSLWSHRHNLELMSILDEVRNQIGVQYPSE